MMQSSTVTALKREVEPGMTLTRLDTMQKREKSSSSEMVMVRRTVRTFGSISFSLSPAVVPLAFCFVLIPRILHARRAAHTNRGKAYQQPEPITTHSPFLLPWSPVGIWNIARRVSPIDVPARHSRIMTPHPRVVHSGPRCPDTCRRYAVR